MKKERKTERNIMTAFLLNLIFSVFELVGGAITGSVAIVSDAVHDMGDAVSIGVSWFLERKSKKDPDDEFTYGYMRYSVIGSVITTLVLLVGSFLVIVGAIKRIFNPVEINYGGMIIFALVGAIVNFVAAYVTRDGDSLNQKAVNLHMLEDVLGWIVVLVGAVVMHFTDFAIIDSLMSLCVAVFILINAVRNLKEALNLFLERTPSGIDVKELEEHLCEIDGVSGVHHIHIWSMDGVNNYATMHIVTDSDGAQIKEKVRKELKEHNICHATLELESIGEECHHQHCKAQSHEGCGHHHHHHHHHHH